MPKTPPFLSKTKYLDGVKCPKLLWYEFNNRSAIPETDAATQAIFDQGTRVGEIAQKLFPNGIKIEREQMPEKTHAKSLEALKLRRPLFESGLTFKQTYALPDILVPADGGAWDIIEVKSSSEIKDEHYLDVAFQKYVYTGAGLKIRNCYLMHIDTEYIRKGNIEPEKLLKKKDISKEIKPLLSGLETSIYAMLKIISVTKPDLNIGPQCSSPYACPLEDLCWSFLPERNIFELWSGRQNDLFLLLKRGIQNLTDIPENELNEKQLAQLLSHKSGKPYIDRSGIRAFISDLKYPLYFLDFETIAPAVPVYDLSHPFEKIPFQFSLHIVQKEGAKPVHHGYLAPGDLDPRLELLKKLKDLLGESGTVIAYNMTFELSCLKYAVTAYPAYKSWFEKLKTRFVDLMAPFRSFSYYHPDQQGSYSIKFVLPAMTHTTYDGLEISDGGTASREYERVTFDQNIAASDRLKVRQALEKYCCLDTQAMIDVLDALKAALE